MRAKFPQSFSRLSEISLKNIGRNMFLSVATTVMMGLILFIFNIIMVLNVLAQSSIDKVNEKADLIIYISEVATIEEVEALITDVESIPVVTEVSYTTKGEALREFLSLYPEKSDPFSTYGIENPLPGNIRILTEEPDQHGLVTDYLKESPYSKFLLDIESSNENQEIIARLISVTSFTEKLIVGVVVTFVFGSLLIIVNAIHLSIFTRKREIQIMQLVGAHPRMIRMPFIAEGAIYSLVAVLFSFTLLIFFVEGSNIMDFTAFQENFRPAWLFLIELVASLTIGIVSSIFAINYYLKKTLVLEST